MWVNKRTQGSEKKQKKAAEMTSTASSSWDGDAVEIFISRQGRLVSEAADS